MGKLRLRAENSCRAEAGRLGRGPVNSQAKRWAGCRGTARPPRGQGIVRGHKGGGQAADREGSFNGCCCGQPTTKTGSKGRPSFMGLWAQVPHPCRVCPALASRLGLPTRPQGWGSWGRCPGPLWWCPGPPREPLGPAACLHKALKPHSWATTHPEPRPGLGPTWALWLKPCPFLDGPGGTVIPRAANPGWRLGKTSGNTPALG